MDEDVVLETKTVDIVDGVLAVAGEAEEDIVTAADEEVLGEAATEAADEVPTEEPELAEAAGPEPVELEVPEPADPEAESAPIPIPLTGWQVPVKDPLSSFTVLFVVTSGPGLGYSTSFPSTVVQPFPRFATKSDGRSLNATAGASLLDPPVMVTEAQSM